MRRSVLFIDPPAFCTTVEGLVAPALRARPIAVAAPGADRATVLALSPEARMAGITRGMPVRQAKKRCPDLILVPPNLRLYARASAALHEILRQYAPVIEPKWYGHAFLDMTGTGRLFGPAVDVAARIQREASEQLRLPVSVGVAGNKLVSEACGVLINQGLAGLLSPLQVPNGEEAPFLAPYSIAVLPDVEPAIRERLDEYQLGLIGQIAAIEERQLCAVFGTRGRWLRASANGIDPRPVLPPELKAEFRARHTLATDTNDLGVLHPLLRRLAEQLGRRLRERRLEARRLTVEIAWTDYAIVRRRVPLGSAALDVELWDAARRAFALASQRTVAIRSVDVSVDRLVEADFQLELWGDRTGDPELGPEWSHNRRSDSVLGTQPSALLQGALDRIRARWGVRGVRQGLRTEDRV
jgi:DNA polymerase-4